MVHVIKPKVRRIQSLKCIVELQAGSRGKESEETRSENRNAAESEGRGDGIGIDLEVL